MDLAYVHAALEQPQADIEKARAYRHVLALLYAVHAPTRYLVRNHRALESRIDAYAGLLQSAGIIDARLLILMQRVPLEFAVGALPEGPPRFVEHKAVNAVRLEVAGLPDVPNFYDLDRLHVRIDSTIDGALQDQVTRVLRRLASPTFVAANGLHEPRMLARGDPRQVTYSFLLLESRPEANFVRVQTDTRNSPFDINEGMKLELGSTAKLRTLAHYLEVMTQLHGELSPLDTLALQERAANARDSLTGWAAATLHAEPGLDLEAFLSDALERPYSASPVELFSTGGGVHRFHNFESQDNRRVMSVREAAVHSTNLVYIRVMRDLVHFHEARLPYDASAVLAGRDAPTREKLLAQIADDETRKVLAHAYHRYRELRPPEILARLLGKRARSHRQLAMVFYAWRAGDAATTRVGANALAGWLQAGGGDVRPDEVQRLEHAYGNPRLNIADFGYLLNLHPLELWCAGELSRNPQISWHDLLARSAKERGIASTWPFNTRNRKAQDVRLRARIERDAFTRMTPYWRSLGFPFEALVPSYATSIGSSGDRPMALAELMGIILNEGYRRPTIRVRRLGFGVGTPYHTVLERIPGEGDPVMQASVARLLRKVLTEVVEHGTARRVNRAFADEIGVPIRVAGKTGSGDNRLETFARGGKLVSSHAVSRTATFVFYLGDRWFGVITASVSGPQSASYAFTSSLPLAVLKLLAPTLSATIRDRPRYPRIPLAVTKQ